MSAWTEVVKMGIQTLGLDLAQPGGIVASLPSVGWNVEGDLDDNDAAIGSHTPVVQTVARVRVVPANSISPAASASERLPPPPPSPSAVVCLSAVAWSVHP